MKLINTQNSYTFVLTELEWYLGTDQEREAWTAQVVREAAEFRCRYATILVEPDAVLSISPIAKRHKVWGHTFPSDDEHVFRADLVALLRANLNVINAERMRVIAGEVFGK